MKETRPAPQTRMPELDLMRGLAVLFMIAVHTQMLFTAKPETKLLGGKIVAFLGGAPAAPTFLFLMGFLIGLKKRGPFPILLKRAGELLLLGYALNFFRFSLPIWLGVPLQGEPWPGLLMIDILQLAAPVMLLLWALKSTRKILSLGFALAIALAAPFLWGLTKTPHPFDFLWGDGYLVFFSFFPWAAYPLFGFFSSQLSKKLRLGISCTLSVAGVLSYQLPGIDFENFSYYRSFPGQTLWMMGFCGIWLSVASWLAPRTPLALAKPLRFFSLNVTSAYVFSWLILSWGVALLGYRQQSFGASLLVMIFTSLLTATAILAWKKISARE